MLRYFCEVSCEISMAVSLPRLLLRRSMDGLLALVHPPSWELDFYLLLLLLTMER
jgi:hypothetical protein